MVILNDRPGGVKKVRIDRNNGKEYGDFWEWLRDDGHMIWIITLVFGCAYYLFITEEI